MSFVAFPCPLPFLAGGGAQKHWQKVSAKACAQGSARDRPDARLHCASEWFQGMCCEVCVAVAGMAAQSQERVLDQAHAALREERSMHEHCQQELAATHEQVLRLEAMLSDSVRELDALQVSLLCPATAACCGYAQQQHHACCCSTPSCVLLVAAPLHQRLHSAVPFGSKMTKLDGTHSTSCCSNRNRRARSTRGTGSWR